MKFEFSLEDKTELKKPHILLASWFGCGYMNPAPGTWGSLGALPFGLLLFVFGGVYALMLGVIIVTTIGLWAAQKFDEEQDSHDSKTIVIDEVAGMWIALIPAGLNPILILIAFLAFRAFDITKPFPVCYFDKDIKGSAGVMGDDLVAGIMAMIVTAAIGWLVF